MRDELSPKLPRDLGALLRAERSALIDRWRLRVQGASELASNAIRDAPQLDDHVPELIDRMIEALVKAEAGHAPTDPESDPFAVWGSARMAPSSATNDAQRVAGGYALAKALCELADLRFCILELSTDKQVTWHPAAATIVHGAIDRAIVALAEEMDSCLLAREQQARAHVDAASLTRDEFLATVSHELRTPLHAILGWASILRQPGVASAEAIARGAEIIVRNAESQARMIGDILDIAQVRSGNFQISVQRTDICAVVESALASVRAAARAKQIELSVSAPPNAIALSADPERLRQAVWNIVANAVKFTPLGGKVAVEIAREGAHVQVCVRDNGEGIAPEFLPFAFDSFTRGDTSLTRARVGMGLGLSVARHFVELHGGTIRAESEGLGQGATFVVALPVSLPLPDQEPPG